VTPGEHREFQQFEVAAVDGGVRDSRPEHAALIEQAGIAAQCGAHINQRHPGARGPSGDPAAA
jgi:hypothetical protein